MSDPSFAQVAWRVWRDSRATATEILSRQQNRLTALVAHARQHSPYYADLYAGLPHAALDLRRLPVVAKPELMANFDDWVSDPNLTRPRHKQTNNNTHNCTTRTRINVRICMR